MKKVMLFFAAVFAAFCFSSCEEEKEEQVELSYTLYAVDKQEEDVDVDILDVVIFEIDKQGKAVDKKCISRLSYGNDVTITTTKNDVSRLEIYSYRIGKYYFLSKSLNKNSKNEICPIVGASVISEQEYLQGINR